MICLAGILLLSDVLPPPSAFAIQNVSALLDWFGSAAPFVVGGFPDFFYWHPMVLHPPFSSQDSRGSSMLSILLRCRHIALFGLIFSCLALIPLFSPSLVLLHRTRLYEPISNPPGRGNGDSHHTVFVGLPTTLLAI